MEKLVKDFLGALLTVSSPVSAGVVRDTSTFTGNFFRKFLSFVGQKNCSSRVSTLFFQRYPAAIFLVVVSIYVLPLNGKPFGAYAHIPDKVVERIFPILAHGYSPSPIVHPVIGSGISASIFHCIPGPISPRKIWRITFPVVVSGSPQNQTATTHNPSTSQTAEGNIFLSPAVTFTGNSKYIFRIRTDAEVAPKPKSNKIGAFFMVRPLRERFPKSLASTVFSSSRPYVKKLVGGLVSTRAFTYSYFSSILPHFELYEGEFSKRISDQTIVFRYSHKFAL